MVFTNSLSSYYEKMLATGEVKCIDEEIPFEIPQGWEWERFGNVMINKDSERVPLSVAQRQHLKKTYDYYGASGVIDKVDKYLFDKDLLLIGEDGANLINRSTPIAFIAKGKYWVNNHAHVLDVCSEMALSYVALFINAISLVDYGTGTAQPKMNQEKMNSILLAIPPVKEQHRILEKMSMVDAFIDKYATLQTKLDSLDNSVYELLRKSILQEAIQGKLVPQIAEEGSAQELLEQIKAEKQKLVKEGKLKKSALATSVIFRGDDNKYYEQVGKKCLDITEQIPFETPKNWVWTRLSHIANIYTGNSISETEKKSKFTDVIGRYYIGTKDVDFNNRIIYDNGIAIPKQYEPDFRLAPNNSILMCIEGGSAGRKIAILNQDVCFGNKLCCFSPFVGIGKYMYYYLQSPSFFELFNLNKTGIIGGVSIAKVKEILIPLPPIKEQQRIVAQIEKLFEQLR